MPRPTPFDLVFAPLVPERFPAIQAALAAAGRSPGDRDAFLITREAAALVRELRPDNGLGEGIDELAALVHHAYLFWADGRRTGEVAVEALDHFLSNAWEPDPGLDPSRARYLRVPERRIWARPIPGEPFEPLDGCFVDPGEGGQIRVLGVFGLHPDRLGFTVVESEGPRPARLSRQDGTPLFAPTLPGGARAGLYGVEGSEELVELGWRLLSVPLAEGDDGAPDPGGDR